MRHRLLIPLASLLIRLQSIVHHFLDLSSGQLIGEIQLRIIPRRFALLHVDRHVEAIVPLLPGSALGGL